MKKNILKVLGVLVLFITLSLNSASALTPPERVKHTQTTINVSPSGFTIRVFFDDVYYSPNYFSNYMHIGGYVDIFMKYHIIGNPSTIYEAGQDASHLVYEPWYPG